MREERSGLIQIVRVAGSIETLLMAGFPVALLLAFAIGGQHTTVVVVLAYLSVIYLFSLPLLLWLVTIGSWRGSNALWRERMKSGFYETLPPVEDDDDD
jgi:hypothetical protein